MGTTYGKWEGVGLPYKNEKGRATLRVRCVCGTEKDVDFSSLKAGRSKGCSSCHTKQGKAKTHGKSKTRTYKIWRGMKARCDNEGEESYPYYGGRGISYDAAWKTFDQFFADMGEAPEGGSIDRIDNEGNYSKENCRWATAKEQANNTSRNHTIEFRGETRTLAEWSEVVGIKYNTLHMRLTQYGWTEEQALTTPVKPHQ